MQMIVTIDMEDYNEDTIMDTIETSIAREIKSKVDAKLNEKINELAQQAVLDKLNNLIESELKFKIKKTNNYGEPIEEKETTIKELIVQNCQNWFEQTVDKYGNPKGASRYDNNIMPRYQYLIKKDAEDFKKNLERYFENQIKTVKEEAEKQAKELIADFFARKILIKD